MHLFGHVAHHHVRFSLHLRVVVGASGRVHVATCVSHLHSSMLRYAREALERLDEQAASYVTAEGGGSARGEGERTVPTVVRRGQTARERHRWTRDDAKQAMEALLVRWDAAVAMEEEGKVHEEAQARRREAEAQQMRAQAAQMRREARAEQLACGEERSSRNATASAARARARELEQEIADGAEAAKDAQKRTERRNEARARLVTDAHQLQTRLAELQKRKQHVSERWKSFGEEPWTSTDARGKETDAMHEAKLETWRRKKEQCKAQLEQHMRERQEPTSNTSKDAAKRRVAHALEREREAKATRADVLRREVESLRMAVREATMKREEARRKAPSGFPPPGRIGTQEAAKDVLLTCVKVARRSAAVRLSTLAFLIALHGLALVLLAWRL